MSPTISTRSSSLSSISSSTYKSSKSVDSKKKFACSHPGCGKAFSRSEHLHRHALNHKDGNNTCLRCSAHFRRRDLLDRHMARHKEKDDEAGGEGLGILATRKRLWRDADGNIVNARRPSYTQEGAKRRQLTRADRKSSMFIKTEDKKSLKGQSVMFSLPSPTNMARGGSTSSTIVVDTGASPLYSPDNEEQRKVENDLQNDTWLDMSALPSPPTSHSSLSQSLASPAHSLSDLDALYDDEDGSSSWPPLQHDGLPSLSSSHNPSISTQGGSEYPPSPSWETTSPGTNAHPFQTFMGAMAELPYDDIFKPEAGLYDWQSWNSQVLMSRCREEKFDPLFSGANEERKGEREREWMYPFPSTEGGLSFRRPFGLGTC